MRLTAMKGRVRNSRSVPFPGIQNGPKTPEKVVAPIGLLDQLKPFVENEVRVDRIDTVTAGK